MKFEKKSSFMSLLDTEIKRAAQKVLNSSKKLNKIHTTCSVLKRELLQHEYKLCNASTLLNISDFWQKTSVPVEN